MGSDDEYITGEEMRQAEKGAAATGITVEVLMENAGRGVANEIELDFGPIAGKRIVVVAGKGNNGGDGFVTARYLIEKGADVVVILLADPKDIKTEESKNNWVRLDAQKEVVSSLEQLQAQQHRIEEASIIVDAIFGTGISGGARDPEATAIRMMNAATGRKVAIDIPSGIDPDTGEVKEPTVIADLTVTLHRAKIGLQNNGKYTGKLVVVPIGIG